MIAQSKRPSFRKRRKARRKKKRLAVVISDENRKPFPGLDTPPAYAQYFVTSLGHVYRDDGRLLAVDARLMVRLNNGRYTRSVPLAVVAAFCHTPPNYGDVWRPWVDPDGPIHPLTGRLRCSVADIRFVTHSDVVRFGRTGIKPTNIYPLL